MSHTATCKALKLAGFVTVLVVYGCGAALAQPYLEVDGERAEYITFLRQAAADTSGAGPLADSWMGKQAGNVLLTLRQPDFKRLAACMRSRTPQPEQLSPAHLGYMTWMYYYIGRGDKGRRGTVQRFWDGRLLFGPINDEAPFQFCWLDADRFHELVEQPPLLFRWRFDEKPDPALFGKTHESIIRDWGALRVDRAALRQRFFSGIDPPPPSKITPAAETYKFRLPRSLDPKFPVGLLIWVSPSNDGSPPPGLHTVADELNLILAGADQCGNDRPTADRLQLSVSIIADLSYWFHFDPRRVYVSGLSGGGKIATILQAGCPEIFSGCIPIVGTGWRRDVRLASGKAWPKIVGQPAKSALELLRSRRIAPITGPEDFNYKPVLSFADQMKDDGITVRVFDVPGLKHELPSAEILADAVRWIDEPWRETRTHEEERGRALMSEYLASSKPDQPRTPEARALLERLTAEAPWTEESWRAIELLKER